ncbi:MAG TPA: antibiotic biosynthesis monooxygenase [Gammaproteobacteria bacterium]|nr:antibiotic biosynthesis monooxygenase [Gammaproteobacteria bacterium]HBP99379.1 antibiotic biosynthesis monooxygenase [Gammaproteobacteria bacterium]HCL72100.1 antibiotic biosynthesis monooxygenase [Gammaproteobacteria bacterium]
MVFNNVILRVKESQHIAEVASLLAEQARLSSAEPGCESFVVYHSETEPELFLLIEAWESQQHLAQHREAKAFTELYVPRVIPLVERQPHLCRRIWPD